MTNDNFQWRFYCRIAVIFCSVISTLQLCFALFSIFYVLQATVGTEFLKDPLKMLPVTLHTDFDRYFVIWIIFLLILMVGSTFIDIFVAEKIMMKATKLGTDPKVAMESARIWRNVNIEYFLVNMIFWSITRYYLIAVPLEILYRGVILYVITKFIQELQPAAESWTTFTNPSASQTVVIHQL